MKRVLFLATMMAVVSCSKKEYRYVEVREETNIGGGKELVEIEEIIEEKNDTLAYIKAYESFIISKKVRNDSKEAGSQFPTDVKSFKLFNEEGEDISNIVFLTKETKIKEIEQKIFSIPNRTKDMMAKKSGGSIDSIKIKELKPFFREKKDEFEGHSWVQYKTIPQYRDQNGFYCYFEKSQDNKVSNLRFVGQYLAEDWLFITRIKFSIDGKVWDYTPNKMNNDHDTRIWEWFDDEVDSYNSDLVNAIASAKEVKVRFIGKQYHDERRISKENIKSIQKTLEYYKALGGEY